MSNHRMAYVFSLIRYVPDAFSGEFLNVGVVAFVPSTGQLEVRVSKNYVRVIQAFPGVKLGVLSSRLDHLEARLKNLKAGAGQSFRALVSKVLPADESSLQLSKSSSGVSGDVAKSVTELFERFVIKSEAAAYGEIEAFAFKRAPHRRMASHILHGSEPADVLFTASNEESCYSQVKLELVS